MQINLEIQRWISLNVPCYAVSASGDGQYVVVGHENGATIFNSVGDVVISNLFEESDFPVIHIVNNPEFSFAYILARTGVLIRLALKRQAAKLVAKPLVWHKSRNADLKSLAISGNGQKIAVGYLCAGLAIFDQEGKFKRLHPDDGTATDGSYWSVALNQDGSKLYTGSASVGSGLNFLGVFETTQLHQEPLRYRLPSRSSVKDVLMLPDQVLIVASIWDDNINEAQDHIICLSPSLEVKMWDCPFDEIVTAVSIAPDSFVGVAGVGHMGRVILFDTKMGQVLETQTKIVLNTLINDIVIIQSRMIAAATEDGHLVILDFLN